MEINSIISKKMYVVIAIGMLMIPIGIGLIILACVAWHIGTKMERGANKIEEQYTGQDFGEQPSEEIPTMEVDERYKCEEYAPEVLEDGK